MAQTASEALCSTPAVASQSESMRLACRSWSNTLPRTCRIWLNENRCSLMTTVSPNPAVARAGDLLDQMTLKTAVANSQRYAAEGDRTILSGIAATAAGFFYVPTEMRG
jgi:hypothetical protein